MENTETGTVVEYTGKDEATVVKAEVGVVVLDTA